METKQEHYESMMQAIARYAPSADLEVIQRAYAYADEKHKNQLRKSGEPYIIHPLAVAEPGDFDVMIGGSSQADRRDRGGAAA